MTKFITTSGISAAMLNLMVVDDASSVALHVLALAEPNSMVIAFDIYILSHIQPEIGNFRFTAAMLDFRLNGLSDNVGVSIEKFDPGNTG